MLINDALKRNRIWPWVWKNVKSLVARYKKLFTVTYFQRSRYSRILGRFCAEAGMNVNRHGPCEHCMGLWHRHIAPHPVPATKRGLCARQTAFPLYKFMALTEIILFLWLWRDSREMRYLKKHEAYYINLVRRGGGGAFKWTIRRVEINHIV